jgi:hypothetical protein
MRNALDLIAELGRYVVLVMLALVIFVFAGILPSGTDVPAGTPAAQATPATDTATEDVQAEGQDVLMLRYDTAPHDLWQGLIDAGYRGVASDPCTCLYVPTGAVVDVPGGLYLATPAGWAICRDGWSDQECSPDGPVWPIGIPVQNDMQTDGYGCFFDPEAPAWESATTTDGLCHDGPHSHEVTGDLVESPVLST